MNTEHMQSEEKTETTVTTDTAKPTPHPIPQAPSAKVVPTPTIDPKMQAEAESFGRVDDDGTVWVKEEQGERAVGQYTIGDKTEALNMYVRRYLDLQASVALLEVRLEQITAKEATNMLSNLKEQLQEPAVVGNIQALRVRVEAIEPKIEKIREEEQARRAAAREKALREREALVEKAQAIAQTPLEKTRWKQASDEIRMLLEQWKELQRRGPRLERSAEDALWKSFSQARTAFDRQRRHFFAEIDTARSQAKARKEELVLQAEEIAHSTDWANTANAYKILMEQWRKAGQAARKVDEQLWARFRTAQQKFFDARNAENQKLDEQYQANLEAKLAILEQAEKLIPVTDIAAAKAALRDLQDKWETVGRVPRSEVSKVEGRLRAVEQAVRDAESAEWRRTDPETKARAQDMSAQLHEAIAKLEAELETAQAKGDKAEVKKAQEALEARRSWLALVEKAN